MINNRQGGRRRGRGGGPRSPNSGPNPGNRQDNRSRGNAAQLLEKYKSLARDAQMQGDRVQSEYFLQFAEHYFRVLNENRARFEEQRPRTRDDYYSDEDEDQDESASAADEGDEREPMEEREERPFRAAPERPDRDRNDRGDRNERPRRDFRAERNGEYRQERRPREDREERPRREVNGSAPQPESERIALDVLPPAISPTISVVEGDSEPKAPRRRTRRPRTDEGEAEIAPAA